jgi:hypothetical protein
MSKAVEEARERFCTMALDIAERRRRRKARNRCAHGPLEGTAGDAYVLDRIYAAYLEARLNADIMERR